MLSSLHALWTGCTCPVNILEVWQHAVNDKNVQSSTCCKDANITTATSKHDFFKTQKLQDHRPKVMAGLLIASPANMQDHLNFAKVYCPHMHTCLHLHIHFQICFSYNLPNMLITSSGPPLTNLKLLDVSRPSDTAVQLDLWTIHAWRPARQQDSTASGTDSVVTRSMCSLGRLVE